MSKNGTKFYDKSRGEGYWYFEGSTTVTVSIGDKITIGGQSNENKYRANWWIKIRKS